MIKVIKMNKFNLHIEEYVLNGKVKRIVIRTDEENYLMDFRIDTFTSRSILTAVIEFVKAATFIIPRFHVEVVRLSEQV